MNSQINHYGLTVTEIIIETNSTKTFKLKQPQLKKINYKNGQYLTVLITINGVKYKRPYSISSSFGIDPTINITVKRIEGGIVSNYLNNNLKEGDILEVMQPMGDFIYDIENRARPVYFWAAGSGITPMLSIIKNLLIVLKHNSVHLIYANKNVESSIFGHQLKKLEQDYTSFFNIINFYSKEKKINEDDRVKKGRVTSEFLDLYASKNINIIDGIHYICGPNDFKNTIKKALEKFQVPLSSVFIEDFQFIIGSNFLENLSDSKVTIILQNKRSEIFVKKGKNILEIALENNIAIPYSCRNGTCLNCKAKIKMGELKVFKLNENMKLLAENEFLLCCSYPLTNQVLIEVE